MKMKSHIIGVYVVCDCRRPTSGGTTEAVHVQVRLQTKENNNGEKIVSCWNCYREVKLKLTGGLAHAFVSGTEVGNERQPKNRLIINFHEQK